MMISPRGILLVLLAALGVFGFTGAGCRNPVTSAGMTMESYPGNRVTVNSRLFGGWFKVVNSAVAQGDNGLLKVTISLESQRDNSNHMEYRFRWIDADGIEVTSGSSVWISKVAAARETIMITGVAPTKRAADFILDMRFVYPSTRWK